MKVNKILFRLTLLGVAAASAASLGFADEPASITYGTSEVNDLAPYGYSRNEDFWSATGRVATVVGTATFAVSGLDVGMQSISSDATATFDSRCCEDFETDPFKLDTRPRGTLITIL